jgi:hypothetical protein
MIHGRARRDTRNSRQDGRFGYITNSSQRPQEWILDLRYAGSGIREPLQLLLMT